MQFNEFEEFDRSKFPNDGSEYQWEMHTTDSGAFYLNGTESNPDLALAVQAPERKYSVKSSLPFSHYLNKESSSRYQAIVLNVSGGYLDRPENAHFEVGLVHIRNPEHRNGVIHALRVSPFHVDFIQLDEAFFEYMHSHIYSERTQLFVLEQEQKKKSQKTKNWGEGERMLTAE